MGAVVPGACRSQVPDGAVVQAQRSGFDYVRPKHWRVKAEEGMACLTDLRPGEGGLLWAR